jgi:hypothetical protein
MILLAVGCAYLAAWVLAFLTSPAFLVPGFLYDRSLATLWHLLGLTAQLAVFSLLALLLWAGLGFVRYVLAFYFLIAGLFDVVASISMNAYGGYQLFLGVLNLTCAAVLAVSVGVARYVEHRRRGGIPWFSLGLGTVGLFTVFVVTVGIDLVRAHQAVQSTREETAVTSGIMESFARTLDPEVINRLAEADLRRGLAMNDFADQCDELKSELGHLQSFQEAKPPSMADIMLYPHPSLVALEGTAIYDKGKLLIFIELNVFKHPPLISSFNVEKIVLREKPAPTSKNH